MPSFGNSSKEKLMQCDQRLQTIMFEAIEIFDFTVITGHRDKEEQTKMFAQGNSKLEWPHSKHNRLPSRAIDIAPWPIDWLDRERFFFMAGIIKGIALKNGVGIRWGGDWDGDNDFKENKFDDLLHFEIIP